MILDDIVAYKKLQVITEKERCPLDKLIVNCEYKNVRNFKKALIMPNISIIAEIKRASPSKGIINEDFDHIKTARIYEKVKIDAVSVLTERKFFKGKDEYIAEVKNISSKPILRKDFIIDEYQMFQSKAIGADAVLLIVSILGDKIKNFLRLARELGLYCLTEVHNEQELDLALSAGCDIVGINNRDLRDFTVDLKNTERLIKYIPKNTIVVSESGIKISEDIRYLKSLGVNAVLIGETFMRNMDKIRNIENFMLKSKSYD
ncbi:MAG: indole-3-glycerol phosphate synthase TrpC [Clostridiaceae bacterium]|nr:indole-3-glycerol phosphate synthase TrpC [Clostridiaceae bacterium]